MTNFKDLDQDVHNLYHRSHAAFDAHAAYNRIVDALEDFRTSQEVNVALQNQGLMLAASLVKIKHLLPPPQARECTWITAIRDLDTGAALVDEELLREFAEKCLKHLVLWRCVNCGLDLYEIPEEPFGKCPCCGVASHLHGIFSDDREGLLAFLRR